MPLIKLKSTIKADINIVFDLSRSVELHKISTKETNEQAVAGKVNGMMDLNETVTWRAKHFGIYHKLTSIITSFDRPYSFTDEMQKGIFKSMEHQHIFRSENDETIMSDLFYYQAPFGLLGTLSEKLFLTSYLTNFLKKRNDCIKYYAEGPPETLAQILR